jgi:hypothetical protein
MQGFVTPCAVVGAMLHLWAGVRIYEGVNILPVDKNIVL